MNLIRAVKTFGAGHRLKGRTQKRYRWPLHPKLMYFFVEGNDIGRVIIGPRPIDLKLGGNTGQVLRILWYLGAK
jgi:hypothetical protein